MDMWEYGKLNSGQPPWSQKIRIASRYWSGSEKERIGGSGGKLVPSMPQRQTVLFIKIRMKSGAHMWPQTEEQLSIYRFLHWCSERFSIQLKWHVFNSHSTCYEQTRLPCYHLKFYNKYFSALASPLSTAEFSPLQSPRKSEYEPTVDIFSFDIHNFTEIADLEYEMQRCFIWKFYKDLWLQGSPLYPYYYNAILPTGSEITMFLHLEALSQMFEL